MTDEEYLFRQTEKERKRIARGAHNKKRGGGKTVRMPSDYLSRREREALNGEVKTYKKKDFYTWQEFKELPNDLQVAWVNSCINRYGVGLGTISEVVFGGSRKMIYVHFQRANELKFINKPLTGKAGQIAKKKLAAAFENWKNTQITMCEDQPAEVATEEASEPVFVPSEEETEKPEIKVEEKSAINWIDPAPAKMDASNIAALIAALAGSGAKLTIEVTL